MVLAASILDTYLAVTDKKPEKPLAMCKVKTSRHRR